MLAVRDLGHLGLGSVEARVALAHDTLGVAQDDLAEAHVQHELADGNTGRAGAVDDDGHLTHLLARHLHGVEHSRRGHDGSAVLVVVEDGDVADFLQTALDLKAAGSRDVLEVDAAERLGDELDGAHDLVGVLGVDAQGEGVDIAELLEQDALALHDGHTGSRADVTQAKNGGTVGDDGHEVVAAGEVPGLLVVLVDGTAGLGNAGRVEQRQVLGALDMLAGAHLDLAAHLLVKLQALLAYVHARSSPLV